MKVAAVQMTSGPDVTVNLEQARGLLEEAAAQGAGLAVLPENFAFMGLHDADKRAVGESDGSGPIQDFLSSTALKLRVTIVAGTIPLRAGEDGRVAAASLVYGPDGKRVGRYDKIHLFDADTPDGKSYRESATMRPGEHAVVAGTPWGGLGLTICYDVRFAHLYRALANQDARMIAVPAAFTVPTGQAHWEVMLRARAIETGAWVLAPAQGGLHEDGRTTYGHSMVIDPWGKVVAALDHDRPAVLTARLDLTRVDQARQALPQLRHDREFTV